jgi:hypothetical protein
MDKLLPFVRLLDPVSGPLDAFRVSLRPGEPASILHIEGSWSAAQAWTMHELTLAPGYAAALAYYGSPREVRVFPTSDPADLLTWV